MRACRPVHAGVSMLTAMYRFEGRGSCAIGAGVAPPLAADAAKELCCFMVRVCRELTKLSRKDWFFVADLASDALH